MPDNSIHISIGESNGNETIRLYESENGRIRMGASEGTPKYIGARAIVTRVDGGVKITLSDYKGTTEEIVYESSVTSYNELLDKPEIEGIVLEGNKTFSQLDLNVLPNTEIQTIFNDLI